MPTYKKADKEAPNVLRDFLREKKPNQSKKTFLEKNDVSVIFFSEIYSKLLKKYIHLVFIKKKIWFKFSF